MIKNSDLLEALADAIRVRRRTPKSLYPHPFELSLITLNVEDNTLMLKLMDGPKTCTYKLFLLEIIEEDTDS